MIECVLNTKRQWCGITPKVPSANNNIPENTGNLIDIQEQNDRMKMALNKLKSKQKGKVYSK